MSRHLVVNRHRTKEYDVYIGRPSKWGNPFVIPADGTREEVVRKYAEWLPTLDVGLAQWAGVAEGRFDKSATLGGGKAGHTPIVARCA